MSKFTTEVRYICETEAGLGESVGYSMAETVLQLSAPKIFDFDFPIFDEEYRLPLEIKILRHFYTREISEETVGLWKFRLQTKMNEIMPYYNQLYKSELLEFNPFYDVDLIRTHTMQTDGTTTSTDKGKVKGSNENWEMYSDTPQGTLENVKTGKYLTTATKTTNDGNTESTNDSTGTLKNIEDYIEHVQGKQGGRDYSKLLMNFRKSFLNIDMQIIDELEDLFYGLWE